MPPRLPLLGLLLTVLMLSACLSCDLRPGRTEVRYLVRVSEPSERIVTVSAEIDGLPRRLGELRLGLNSRYAYIMPEAALLAEEPVVRAADGRKLALRRIDPFAWGVATEGETFLRLDYAIPLTHHELPGVEGRDEYEQPFLAETHGMLATGAVFLGPENIAPVDFNVRFELPAGWPVICPWVEREPGVFAPVDLAALRDDLVALGDWKMIETERAGCRVMMAVAPGQPRVERVAAPFIAEIVEAEIELFGMLPQGKYLFLFHPGRPGYFAGSPKTASMTLQLSADTARPFSLQDLARLVAHEFHHTWVYALYAPPDELRFFNEGFTDYYAHLVSARLGIMSWDEFAANLGECIDRCARNPQNGRLSLLAAGGPIFFADQDAADLIYHRGLLLAAILDREIRSARPGRSLDDFMRDFNNDPRWGWDSPPARADFLAAVERELGSAAARRVEGWVSSDRGPDVAAEFRRLGVRVEKMERGFSGVPKRIVDRGAAADLPPERIVHRVDSAPWREHLATGSP